MTKQNEASCQLYAILATVFDGFEVLAELALDALIVESRRR